MPCKICGGETVEGKDVCQRCCGKISEISKPVAPINIEDTEAENLVIITKQEPAKEKIIWTGKYTPEQRADIRHLFGLSDEQIDILEEANNFLRNLLEELKIKNHTQLEENVELQKIFVNRVEEFLHQRNLWPEVMEARALLKDGYDFKVVKEQKPFGAALFYLITSSKLFLQKKK